MKRLGFVSVFVLVGLILGVGVVFAQDVPPTDLNVLGSVDPISVWGDIEFEQLVDLIVEEKLSIKESQDIYEELSEEQILRVGELLGERVGLSADEVRKDLILSRSRMIHSIDDSIEGAVDPCSRASSYLWGCYPCERSDLMARPVHVWYHIEDATECGSSDPDWLFKFGLDYGGDADSLRWRTANTQVQWAIQLAYGSNLNSFNYSFNTADRAYLVVGETCVALGGGVSNFDQDLILGQYP